jgi:hypothetical protein
MDCNLLYGMSSRMISNSVYTTSSRMSQEKIRECGDQCLSKAGYANLLNILIGIELTQDYKL